MEINQDKARQLYDLVETQIRKELNLRFNTNIERAVFTHGARKGEAILGKILRIIITGRSEPMQTIDQFVVKFAVEKFLSNELPIKEIYEREIFMYHKVFPLMMEIQIDVEEKFIAFPEYFGSDPEANPEYIIMRDLRCEGYRTVDRTEPLDYPHMLLVVKQYAKLHALSLVLLKKPQHHGMRKQLVETFYTSMKNVNITFVETHCRRALETLDRTTNKVVLEKYCDLEKSLFQSMKKAATFNVEDKWMVICHGDSSITNFMFKYENRLSKKPTDVVLVDFQMAKVGSPALDLSHLIFVCTDKEVRMKHYNDLLRAYHAELTSFGRILGVEFEFPFIVLEDHMKQFAIYGLYMAITNLYIKMSSDDDVPTVEKINSIDDAKAGVEHPCFKLNAFETRIKDVLIDFHNYGFNVV